MSKGKANTTAAMSVERVAEPTEGGVAGLVRLLPWPETSLPELVPVCGDLLVGREGGCELSLDEDSVSRAHATLRPTGQGVEVTDHGSTNGTFLGSRQILRESAIATPGDVVRFGRCAYLMVTAVGRYNGMWSDGVRGPIVGGPAMGEVRGLVSRFGPMPNSVLLCGESGTGKEVVARALHGASGRAGALVPVNCAAVPDTLFEAHFFGHRRGAFTGADRDDPGVFRAAEGGTLFLDEVGELAQESQSKLLRALETHEVTPLGASAPVQVDVRVVAATNRDLGAAVEAGSFRMDLYARLRVLTVPLQPLRDRPEDVVLLSRHFLGPEAKLRPETVVALLSYHWPGNARELANVLVEASARAQAEGASTIGVAHLRAEVAEAPCPTSLPEESRRDAVVEAMRRHGGNVSHVAAELGIHRPQVYSALREAGLKAEDFR